MVASASLKGMSVLTWLLPVCLLGGCGSSKNAVTAEWKEKNIVADGKTDDWKLPLPYYNTTAKLNYGIAYNNEYLYICLVTADRQTQMQMATAGLEIAIDTTGKKKKQVTIAYPIALQRPSQPIMMPEGESKPSMARGAFPPMEFNTMKITGFRGAVPGEVISPSQNSFHIQAKIEHTADQTFVYELAIPLSSFMAFDKERIVGITFTLNSLPAMRGAGMSAPPARGMGGGGNMPPGGGQGGGFGGPPGGGMGGRMPGGSGAPSDVAENTTFRAVLRLPKPGY